MSCKECDHLSERREFHTSGELERGIAVVHANVTDGTLIEAEYWPPGILRIDQPPFDALPTKIPLPDVFAYYFKCVTCGAHYCFSAETYHGAGGKWRSVEPDV